VSDKSFGGESKVLKKYFQYRNFVKAVTGPLFLPNTMKIKLLILKLSHKARVLKLGRKAISSKIECECEWIVSMNVIQKGRCVEGKSWAYTKVLRRINPMNRQ